MFDHNTISTYPFTADYQNAIGSPKAEIEEKSRLLRAKDWDLSNMVTDNLMLNTAMENLHEKIRDKKCAKNTEKPASQNEKSADDNLVMQERLKMKDQEIINKEKGLERIREKINDLKARTDYINVLQKDQELQRLENLVQETTLARDDKAVTDKRIVDDFQRIITRLTVEAEEKDLLLSTKDLHTSEICRQITEAENNFQQLQQQGQDDKEGLRKEVMALTAQLSTSQQSEKEAVLALELAAEQTPESLKQETVALRSLVEFFKLNSENVAIKNEEALKENRRLRQSGGI